ncbi:MAG: extracellular solute-binding protein [Clostridia bacterium]|nr:extracellular solute-binding protein [Clostridia bacterium]MBQ4157990.1 extracellular solute-binding protein [Clostridia bacterium]
MKKSFVRFLALVTALVMLFCLPVMAETLEYLNTDGAMPIVKDGYDITIEIAAVQGDSWTAKPEDHYIWAFIEKYCNVDLDVKYYKQGSWEEQRSLIFLGDDQPDIIINGSFDNADLVRYGQVEGMLLPMEDLIKEHAPLIAKYGEEHPELYSETLTPDGHMYAIPTIGRSDLDVNGSRVFINQQWMDNLGLEMPTTLDELTEVLMAFKNDDPNGNGEADEIPFLAYPDRGRIAIMTALGMNHGDAYSLYATLDGRVTVGAAEENYVHYLEYMKMLLDEGLLDEDFYTMTIEEFNAKLSRNVVGLAMMDAPFVYMPAPEQYQQYQSLVPLVSDYNDTQIWPMLNSITNGTFVICRDTEYPEVCIRIANVFFEKDINLLAFVGPQASAYLEAQWPVEGWEASWVEEVDGAQVYTTPDGTDLWTYLNSRVGLAIQIGPAYTQDEANATIGIDVPLADHEMFWRNSMRANVSAHMRLQLPNLFLSEDELNRANELRVPIEDYISNMEAKFIMGDADLSTFDAFQEELKALGIEEYLELYQTAYDAYLENSK